jgi:hypothetical protein
MEVRGKARPVVAELHHANFEASNRILGNRCEALTWSL